MEFKGTEPDVPEGTEPKTVPVVVYKDGKRIVVGEATVERDDIQARIFDVEAVPEIAKAMSQGINAFSFGDPNDRGSSSPGDLIFDRCDWDAEERDGEAKDGSQDPK